MITSAARNGSRRLRILVAEDYEDAAQSIAMFLRMYGHEIHIVGDGAQAIASALRLQPDVILLDIGLPRVNGYEVATALRREALCKEALIIAVSGYGQADDLRRSRDAGVDFHLLKPVDAEALLELVSNPWS
jgi:CheY-like chemotaxis protein